MTFRWTAIRRVTACLTLALALSITVCGAVNAQQPSARDTEVKFLTGLALLEQGEPLAAARIFTQILANDPSLVRVRLELGRAYFEARQWQRARREFLTVLSGELPDAVRANVLRFVREIDARRGFDWDLRLGVTRLGDSRVFDADEVLLDFAGNPLPFTLERDDTRALGLSFSADASFRWALGDLPGSRASSIAFAQLSVAGEDGPGARFDDVSVTATAGVRLVWPQTTTSIAPLVARRFVAGEAFEDSFGVEMLFERRDLQGASLGAAISWQSLDNLRRSELDGRTVRARLQYSRPVSGRARIGTSVSFEDKDVDFGLENYEATRLTLFGRYDLRTGITIAPRVFLEAKRFPDPGPLFIDSIDERTIGGGLFVETTGVVLWDGFTPYADLTAQRTRSDTSAFSYRDYGLEVGFERRF